MTDSARRFRAAEPHELDCPPGRQREIDHGPRHFIVVGLFGGFVLGILTAVSMGWWPL